MAVIGNLRVDLGLNSAAFDQGLNKAKSKTEGFAKHAGVAFAAVAAAAAAASVAFGRMADEWSDLNSRLSNATGSIANGAAAMNRLQQVARSSYSSIAQTTEAYIAQATTLNALGVSTNKQLDLTETLNNALVISATRGDKARSVMENWSKAMALGSLRGENLNSVIANSPRLAQALADSMGVSVTSLRQMGEQGKITRAEMLNVTSQLEKLREEAGEMPATIADGMGILSDAVFQLVGRLDQTTGASSSFATMLIAVGDAITASTAGILQFAQVAMASLGPSFESMGASINTVYVALAALFSGEVQNGLLAVAAIAGQTIVLAMNGLASAAKWVSDNFNTIINLSKIWIGLQIATVVVGASRAFFAYARTIQAAAIAKTALATISKINIATLGLLAGVVLAVTGHLDGFIAKVEEATGKLMALIPEDWQNGIQGAIGDLNNLWNAFDGISAAIDNVNTKLPEGGEALGALGGGLQAANDNLDRYAHALSLVASLETPFERMAADIAKLDEALAAAVISWQQYSAAAMNSMASAAQATASAVGQQLGMLSQAFEGNKALAYATAVVKGIESIVSSYAAGARIGGPVVGAAFAATAAAATAGQIAAIGSTSMNSKSMPSARGVANAPTPPQAPGDQRVMNITLAGTSYSRDQVRDLIEAMNEEMGDGVQMRVNGAAA